MSSRTRAPAVRMEPERFDDAGTPLRQRVRAPAQLVCDNVLEYSGEDTSSSGQLTWYERVVAGSTPAITSCVHGIKQESP